MFRAVIRAGSAVKSSFLPSPHHLLTPASQAVRRMSKSSQKSDEELDAKYVAFFSNPNTDGWGVRSAMNDLCGMDLVPDPKVIEAALRACRRVNDYALAVRFLEAVKFKCGPRVKEIYPYIIQEIAPTLKELKIETPEQLGYDKPELAIADVYSVH